jgi:hypothetical protein
MSMTGPSDYKIIDDKSQKIVLNQKYAMLCALSTIIIISGQICANRDVDNSRNCVIGNIVYILGWIFLIIISTLDQNFKYRNQNMSIGGSAILVLATEMFSQTLINNKNQLSHRMMGTFLTFLAWTAFATTISNKNGKYNSKRALYAYIGIILINSGKVVLMSDRGFDNPICNTYSFGLPLITLGWVLIIVSLSIEVNNDS